MQSLKIQPTVGLQILYMRLYVQTRFLSASECILQVHTTNVSGL